MMSVFSADDGSRLCRLSVLFQKMGLKLAVDVRPDVPSQPIGEVGGRWLSDHRMTMNDGEAK